MTTKLLILGGTTEASALAQAVARAGFDAVFSYAGRVAKPKEQPLPTRVGGFGGVDGLATYLRDNSITHVIDATHPFAAQMSWNAYHACAQEGVALIALTRPAWQAQAGDDWHHVADIEGAVAALDGAEKRVLLALGKLNLPAFATQPQHHYILRLVDQPETPPAVPHHTVIVARGPFDVPGDRALMEQHGVEVVVCKNAGGIGAEAKLHAARVLNIPVIMIDRPELPPRPAVAASEEVLAWVNN
ncbi:cobalt-precorrin-6A reductase [Shimia sp. R9_1]|uniref:cobalt-precorrin-6A reductase n=1 Tax=Shimia sp. R9_1 TaxID=2821111 RepID=UPI001ADCA079|nr:cobalt-precorrin-6A reductase [Shimia sp. R9_1]MBO9406118.1 cobalt-precorrin-6A reductase [Shimia sp. R9_1]